MKKAALLASLALALPLVAAAQGAAPPAPVNLMPNQRANIQPVTADDLLKPAGAEWLTYHGDFTGDHYSNLNQVTTANVAKLKRAWVSQTNPIMAPPAAPRGGAPVPATPGAPTPVNGGGRIVSNVLVRSGVLFYSSGVDAFAIDARTGKQIWQYIGRQSVGLSNRGLAISGDTLFMMGNGGLIAIDANTGVEKWVKPVEGRLPSFAPFVFGNHVIAVSGSDVSPARGFMRSFNIQTGDVEWTYYPVPSPGEFGFNTWPSEETASVAAGTPWQPMLYDKEQNLLIFGTGNPSPFKDGRARPGDNLFTDCIIGLNPDTGKMVWYFQATPHDDHDYDNNASMAMADIMVGGKKRKVVTWLSRNGYSYTVDRTTGENIQTTKVLKTANWAMDKLRTNGTVEPNDRKSLSRGGTLVSPTSDGAANFPAQSFSPQTGLHYSQVIGGWSLFYWGGESMFGTYKNYLRADDPATGRTVWTHDYANPTGPHSANYPSMLTTAGGLLFAGDISNNFIAFDAKTGKILWHDELPDAMTTGVPATYQLDGKEYVVVPSGSHIISYVLGS